MATSLNRKDQSVFFYVSPLKLYVMSVVTFGLYEVFWTYKNWFYVEDHTNKRLSPLFRTLFSIIWFYDLIREINKAGEAQGIKGTLSPWLLAFGYVVLGIFANIFAPLYLLWMAILIPVQKHINLMNTNSPTPINDKFTALNIAIIVIFAGYWAWVLFGYLAIFN